MKQIVYVNEGKLELREAVYDDIPDIIDLYSQTESCGWWVDEFVLESHFQILDKCSGKSYVAVLEDEVVSYAEIIYSKEPEPHRDFAFLRTLKIHEELRRRKFGTEIVRFTMIVAKNEEAKGYEVWPQDKRARGLYKNLGLTSIHSLQKLILEPKSDLKKIKPDNIKGLNEEAEPYGDFKVAVGRKYPGQYIWNRAFIAAEKKVLGYTEPIIIKIDLDEETGILLLDKDNLYIFLRPGADSTAACQKFLKQAAYILNENNISKINTYIDLESWEEIKEDEEIYDFFTIEEDKKREHMKINFEED